MDSNNLNDVDDVIGQPEDCKGRDNHQDQSSALSSALELCIVQATDDKGVTTADEAERNQAAHDGLKQVLEDSVANTAPVVRITDSKSDVARQGLLQIAVREQ